MERSNLLSPSYLWMLRDILTFNQQSIEDYSAGPLLAATFHGRRRDLSAAQLLRSFFALPLVTLKIVAAIHWEALRLWLKGARLVPRPDTANADAAAPATTLRIGAGN